MQLNQLTREDFMKRYGHLRPGTYDILSPRYDMIENFSFTKDVVSKEISLNTTGMIAAIARGVRDFELSITHNNHQIHRSEISIHESLDKYCEPFTLDDDNLWTCDKCSEKVYGANSGL